MAKKIAIIGLGDFGQNLAKHLSEKGAEVLAIDNDFEKVEEIKDIVAVAVRLDATDEKALRAQGIQDMDAVVISIGQEFESTLLTVMNLINLGVKKIIARATTPIHKIILEKVGVHYIISPEEEIADKLASSLIYEDVLEWIKLGGDYTIAYLPAPEIFVGKTLQELDIRTKYNVNLITIKKITKVFNKTTKQEEIKERIIGVPGPGTVIENGDILILFGREKDISKLIE
ncbi:MAG: potassium channel family protein [Ignavibacteria bacterium]